MDSEQYARIVAAREASPGRKPRKTGPRSKLIRYDVSKAKKLFLRLYKIHGNMQECADRVGRHVTRVVQWMKEDQDFREEVMDARRAWLTLLDGRMDSMENKALDAFEDALDKETNPNLALRADMAHKVLRGRGYLTERNRVELTDTEGKPVTIVEVVTSHPSRDDEAVDGELREIEEKIDDSP